MTQVQTPDLTCIITWHNKLAITPDPTMRDAVFARLIARHLNLAKSIDIYPADRESPTFAEWIVRITYPTGAGLTIGCVQREPGSPVEFHS